MKKKNEFLNFVLDQLEGFKSLRSRAMFGGYGLYKEDIFFAALAEDRLFFRVSDKTRPLYEEAGMPPFAPYQMKPMRSYFEVPAHILESPPQLKEWANDAVQSARDAKLKRSK